MRYAGNYMINATSHQDALHARAERYRAGAAAIRASREAARAGATLRYEIRSVREDEAEALLQVAQRDDRAAPRGHVLGVFSLGMLLAAISLDDGSYVADPFRRSGEALELLRVRASQLGTRPRRRGFGGLLSRRAGGRAGTQPANASLAGSPPGAGGRLLQL